MTPDPQATPEQPLKTSSCIKVMGVGGAGCNALAHLARDPIPGVELAVLNTDAAVLERTKVEKRLVLGERTNRGLGAGGDPERGRAAAEEDLDSIRQLTTGADLVFVVAGLGGGTGTGGGPVVARAAKEAGALVLGVVMLPFACEGGRRLRQAEAGLAEFKAAADGVICLPNQKVFKLIDEKTSLLEAFAISNDFVAQAVRGIWRLLSKPGLINVDYADLCSVSQGRHTESSLAVAEARGENRAREVTEKLLAHPLVEGGQVLADSSGVLVSIAAGPDLSMTEVNRIMEQINRHCESAHIILGTAIDETLGDRILVTLVAARGESASAPAEPRQRDNPKLTSTRSDTDSTLQFIDAEPGTRPASRFLPPPPSLTVERREQILAQQTGTGRSRKGSSRMRQAQLPLEILSKGRFEKSEPTIHQGQDLDVPTYIRRGVALN